MNRASARLTVLLVLAVVAAAACNRPVQTTGERAATAETPAADEPTTNDPSNAPNNEAGPAGAATPNESPASESPASMRVRAGEGEVVEARIETRAQAVRLVRLAGPFEHPWAMAFLPDGRMLVTERPGRLQLVDDGALQEVEGLPEISTTGQGGLLDVALHPAFEDTGWVYLTFSKPGPGGQTATALARGRLRGTQLADVEVLFVQDRYSQPGRHYGSRLAWRGDGTLLMTVGERGREPSRAQDPGDHAGSMLRLRDDGTAPADNPFVGQEGAHDELFAIGLRNVQGLVVDPVNGHIWASDHGPRGGDELNLVEAGQNYGWPRQTHGRDYRTGGPIDEFEGLSVEGTRDPVHVFEGTLAPSGLALVTGERFANWQGNLLVGGLAGQQLRRLVLDGTEVREVEPLLERVVGRIRDVREGPDGYIYLLTDAPEGALYRLEPAE